MSIQVVLFCIRMLHENPPPQKTKKFALKSIKSACSSMPSCSLASVAFTLHTSSYMLDSMVILYRLYMINRFTFPLKHEAPLLPPG